MTTQRWTHPSGGEIEVKAMAEEKPVGVYSMEFFVTSEEPGKKERASRDAVVKGLAGASVAVALLSEEADDLRAQLKTARADLTKERGVSQQLRADVAKLKVQPAEPAPTPPPKKPAKR